MQVSKQRNKIAMKNFLWFPCLAAVALTGCNQSQPAPQESPAPSKPATIAVDASTAGTITGVVSYVGMPQKMKLLDMTQDPGCPAQQQPSEEIVMKNGKLANVFVYVKEIGRASCRERV